MQLLSRQHQYLLIMQFHQFIKISEGTVFGQPRKTQCCTYIQQLLVVQTRNVIAELLLANLSDGRQTKVLS